MQLLEQQTFHSIPRELHRGEWIARTRGVVCSGVRGGPAFDILDINIR